MTGAAVTARGKEPGSRLAWIVTGIYLGIFALAWVHSIHVSAPDESTLPVVMLTVPWILVDFVVDPVTAHAPTWYRIAMMHAVIATSAAINAGVCYWATRALCRVLQPRR